MDIRVRLPKDGSVLGLNGSPRKGGNSATLLETILSAAREHGASTQSHCLADLQYSPCIGCEACRKAGTCVRFKDDMTSLYSKVIDSKALILVTPVHTFNMTAWMKAFIDRLYCLYNFSDDRPREYQSKMQGRKAVLVAVCEDNDRKGVDFTLEPLHMSVEALGYEVVGELPVTGVFDIGGVAENTEVMTEARDLGVKLAKAVS
ncbi:hypothetical protein KIPB_004710 [Kipferlia bialata]|uniref:NADPH-dependent FMN reductase-like domain-containing protein n=1 Tax=Kipferlia bialata TaxID=797122 RepID=A0A9K3GIG5_9EUKA|nr:hypothetical protein KIPB_004710 [Kipferlia bialata]|eukprot:g4710.t1